jgi:hypothetical protein
MKNANSACHHNGHSVMSILVAHQLQNGKRCAFCNMEDLDSTLEITSNSILLMLEVDAQVSRSLQ